MKSRVLAADASISLLEMIKIAFQDAGFDVFTTSDGKDVLDLAQEIEPDVMLLGISLPEEDGVALGRRLRGLDRFRRIPPPSRPSFSGYHWLTGKTSSTALHSLSSGPRQAYPGRERGSSFFARRSGTSGF